MITTTSWHSYPSSYNLGHPAIKDLFTVPVYVEEKVDGSQFSFGLVDDGSGERVRIRSKGAEMYIEAPEKMFTKAAETVKRLHEQNLLQPGYTYRCEFLAKPKHNSLAYDRVPKDNLILFDVSTGDQTSLSPEHKKREAQRLGLECVPMLLFANENSIREEDLRRLLDTQQSVLGGQLIEGVVIKQLGEPTLFGRDKKVLMGKFVSERFREIHKLEWTKGNPSASDVIDTIAARYCTQARWEKALIHLKEAGQLKGDVTDIGPVMKELPKDIAKECKELIINDLWEHFWPQIRRKATVGFPEYYKNRLMREQFNGNGTDISEDGSGSESEVGEGTPQQAEPADNHQAA